MSMFGAVDLSSLSPRSTGGPAPSSASAASAGGAGAARTAGTGAASAVAGDGAAPGPLVVDVDAHDHGALLDAFGAAPVEPGRPTFIVAHSHKGHPISFMSDSVPWHHKLPDEAQTARALTELEALK